MDMKEKIYLFKVTLKMKGDKIYRKMKLKGDSSLYEFAKVITSAFDFALDHAFAFYSDIYRINERDETYTSFRKDRVKNNYVHNVFEPGRMMLFLFDFGDSWEFLVECCETSEVEIGVTYPIVIKKVGQAPPQYVRNEDEDYYDDEDYVDDYNDDDELTRARLSSLCAQGTFNIPCPL